MTPRMSKAREKEIRELSETCDNGLIFCELLAEIDELRAEGIHILLKVMGLDKSNTELRAALEEIANEDYRGNRSPASTLAFNALKRIPK